MHSIEPQTILRSLAEGVDPLTLAPLPEDSPLQRPYLIRAFFAASSALDQVSARIRKKSQLPVNAGKSWSALEDEELAAAFDRGTTTKLLAADHKRSRQAIRVRLIKMGKISEFEDLD